MANVTSRGSGDSNEINAANFREQLDYATSAADIQAVVNKVLRNTQIHTSIQNEGLTPAQRDKLLQYLPTASKQGLDITKGGKAIGLSFDDVRSLIINAKEPQKLLQSKLRKQAAAVQKTSKEASQQVGALLKQIYPDSTDRKELKEYIGNLSTLLKNLQEELQKWEQNGEQWGAVQTSLNEGDLLAAVEALKEVEKLFQPLNDFLTLPAPDAWPTNAALHCKTVVCMKTEPLSKSWQAVLSEVHSTEREVLSLYLQITPAESPAASLKRLQKGKAALAKQLTREADAIHKKLGEVHQRLADEITRMRQLEQEQRIVLDPDINRLNRGLAQVELQVKGWEKGGEHRAAFMKALDQRESSAINKGLQQSVTSALQAVLPSFSDGLPSDLVDIQTRCQKLVDHALGSLDRSFVLAVQICKTASTLNQKIANAESPEAAEAGRTTVKELTRLADTIHDRCKNLNEHGLRVVKWLKSSSLTGLDTATIEVWCARLQELAKDWGRGGAERERFMNLVQKGEQIEVRASKNRINNVLVQLKQHVQDLLESVDPESQDSLHPPADPKSPDSLHLAALQLNCSETLRSLETVFDEIKNIL